SNSPTPLASTSSTCLTTSVNSSILPTLPASPSSYKPNMSGNLPRVQHLAVSDMLKSHLDLLYSAVETDMLSKNAYYVADLGEVYRLHLQWKTLLPRIEPFY
ncbi:hypothetical protein BGZ83_002240, partial [Gryganskiella cystojenkinii]